VTKVPEGATAICFSVSGRIQETIREDNGPFYLNLTIILAVSGVVISCIACLVAFLFIRKRQARFSVSEKSKACEKHVKA